MDDIREEEKHPTERKDVRIELPSLTMGLRFNQPAETPKGGEPDNN